MAVAGRAKVLVPLVVSMLAITPQECVEAISDRMLSRVFEGSEEDELLRAALTNTKNVLERAKKLADAEAARRCAQPPQIVAQYVEWDDEAQFPHQAKFDAFIAEGAKAVVNELTSAERELRTLGPEALCQRAMSRVAGVVKLVSEPFSDAHLATWKAWSLSDVERYLTTQCVFDKVPSKYRTALLCYARARKGGFARLDELDECDIESEPGLDEWLNPLIDRFEQQLERGARPKKK